MVADGEITIVDPDRSTAPPRNLDETLTQARHSTDSIGERVRNEPWLKTFGRIQHQDSPNLQRGGPALSSKGHQIVGTYPLKPAGREHRTTLSEIRPTPPRLCRQKRNDDRTHLSQLGCFYADPHAEWLERVFTALELPQGITNFRESERMSLWADESFYAHPRHCAGSWGINRLRGRRAAAPRVGREIISRVATTHRGLAFAGPHLSLASVVRNP